MSDNVSMLIHTMAKQLEQRAQVPAADIWPCEKGNIIRTYDYSGEHLLQILYELFQKPVKQEDLAKSFFRPARLAYMVYLFLTEPVSEENAAQRTFVAEKIIECINFLRNDDPFLALHGGNNIIFRADSNGCIKEFENLDFSDDFSPQTERLIRMVFAALSVLVEHTYFAWVGAAREYHGLYTYNGEKYFVRDFYDLKVPHWQFSQNLPWDSLQFISVEADDSTVSLDFNGRGNLNNSKMRKIALRIDGENVSSNEFEEKIATIYSVLSATISEALAESKPMTGEELLLQFIRSQFYSVQTACRKLGVDIDTSVPQSVAFGMLNSKNKPSSFDKMLDTLKHTTDSQVRYQILFDRLNPGNLNKI